MFSARYAVARKQSATRSTHDLSLQENTCTPSSVQRPYIPGHNTSFHSLHTVLSHPVDLPMTITRSVPSSSSPSSSSSQPCSPLVSPLTDARYRFEYGARSTHPQPSNCQSPLSSSQSSCPSTPRSRSITDADIQVSPHSPSRHTTHSRPSTAPHPRSHPFGSGDSGLSQRQSGGNLYDISRLAMGIKTLLSKPAQPSPSRYSLCSTPSDSAPSPVHRVPRKSRPPDLDVAACPSSPPQTSTLADVQYQQARDTTKESRSFPSFSPLTRFHSRDSPDCKVIRGRDDRPRNVLRRRPSGSAKSLKERRDEAMPSTQRNWSSFDACDTPPLPSPSQTKRANMSRLRNGSAWQTPPRPVIQLHSHRAAFDSGSTHESPSDSRSESQSPDEAHTGTHASDVVAIGDDVSSPSPTPYYTTLKAFTGQSTSGHGPSDPWTDSKGHVFAESSSSDMRTGGHYRSLSRKVSARWKKVTSGVAASEKSLSQLSPKVGHAKGRPSLQEWSRARSKERGRFSGRSMDGMGGFSSPEEVWTGQTIGRERSHTDPSADKNVKDAGEGGKVWKLMKRISTGSLRERFQDKEKAVPPVPTIPKEFLDRAKYTDSPSQPADVARPSPPFRRKRSPSLEKQHGARPSVATTSSSPYSSDVASAQFFQRPYSPRSSISSYGEPKLPSRHIISPSEQLRLGDDICEGDETPRSPRRRSASLPPGSRNNTDADILLHSPSSGASNGDTSTTMSGHIFLAEGGVALSPPPRHLRGKPRTSNGSVPNFPSQPTLKPKGDSGSDIRNRGCGTTPQRGSLEHDDIRPQVIFRQLDERRRLPLSEREKTDIWDALLARSDKAGGTLHIGASELMSDSLRLSTYSELS